VKKPNESGIPRTLVPVLWGIGNPEKFENQLEFFGWLMGKIQKPTKFGFGLGPKLKTQKGWVKPGKILEKGKFREPTLIRDPRSPTQRERFPKF